ncbi:RNA 2',3'-cyclic phosphodiesterase [Pseudoalteromonas sp. SSDWG2]|uniref:RNA 2',3'-cyclic phosphodiesterase n=1 Tax=Pseudoalteromonas sp. SSDWG2 TaxID=3139391 RepID=UPI003BA93E44
MDTQTPKHLEPMRLFFALGLDAVSKNKIDNWLRSHVELSKPATQQRNWHLTLAFLGQVTQPLCETLIARAHTIASQPFELALDEHEFWPHNGIFHLKPSSPPQTLVRLATDLLGMASEHHIKSEHSRFRPHVTLARNLKASPLVTKQVPAIQLHCHEFTLYHSTRDEQGLVYKPLSTFALQS